MGLEQLGQGTVLLPVCTMSQGWPSLPGTVSLSFMLQPSDSKAQSPRLAVCNSPGLPHFTPQPPPSISQKFPI